MVVASNSHSGAGSQSVGLHSSFCDNQVPLAFLARRLSRSPREDLCGVKDLDPTCESKIPEIE